MRAVRAGLYLVRDGDTRIVVLVLTGDPEMDMAAVQLQVAADHPGAAARTAAEVRALAVEHNVFRGQVISFGRDVFGERAALLQFHRRPAMIVVEDVDLIAEERGMHPGQHPSLFQLLNEMDGLAEDSVVVFLLTTYRADVLEPALAARPGRVDQAVSMQLPDAEARRRLFHLYRRDLAVDESHLDSVVERTEEVTASFLKELLRRAALVAADQRAEEVGPLSVSAEQLDAALDELLDTRNAMTRTLLGGQRARDSWADGPDAD